MGVGCESRKSLCPLYIGRVKVEGAARLYQFISLFLLIRILMIQMMFVQCINETLSKLVISARLTSIVVDSRIILGGLVCVTRVRGESHAT